jgi:hypothetical protein
MSHKSPYGGLIVGFILVIVPEPTTTVLGLGIIAYSAYRAGWLGKIYQAMKTKEAVDAQQTTDPAKNPVSAAVDLTKNVVGSIGSWFHQRYDNATGKVKGRSEDIVNTIKATPGKVFYGITGAVDFGKNATETGTKYLWSKISGAAASGKEKVEQLTNKPFTLMGSFAEQFTISNPAPKAAQSLENVVTGIGSKLEYTAKKGSDVKTTLVDKASGIKNWVFGIFGR